MAFSIMNVFNSFNKKVGCCRISFYGHLPTLTVEVMQFLYSSCLSITHIGAETLVVHPVRLEGKHGKVDAPNAQAKFACKTIH